MLQRLTILSADVLINVSKYVVKYVALPSIMIFAHGSALVGMTNYIIIVALIPP